MPQFIPEYLTVTEAAKLLGMSRQNFNRRWKSKLTGHQAGGNPRARVRYKRADVEALMHETKPRDLPGDPEA